MKINATYNELKTTIKNLIDHKREGDYWDFKEKFHACKVSLLHDILSMANSLCESKKYIIIGVDSSFNILGVPAADRMTQANLIDFLSKINFSGDIRPEVELHTLSLEHKEIDVIVILNKLEKPFFLSEDYRDSKTKKIVRAGVIYTRVGDKNTAIDRTADQYHIEKMWRQRFGLDLSIIERFKKLLKEPEKWLHNPANKWLAQENDLVSHKHFPVYHKHFSEFKIELSEPEESEGESFCYFYMNPKSYLGKAYFKYHSTVVFELEYFYCDEMNIILPVPELKNLNFKDIHGSWFYYYTLDNMIGYFLQFLHIGRVIIDSGRGLYPPVLIFKDTEELESFVEYVKDNEKIINNIKPPFLPFFGGIGCKYFQSKEYEKYNSTIEINALFISRLGKLYNDWPADKTGLWHFKRKEKVLWPHSQLWD